MWDISDQGLSGEAVGSEIAQTRKRGSSARFYVLQDPDKTGHLSAPKIVTQDSPNDATVELNHKSKN